MLERRLDCAARLQSQHSGQLHMAGIHMEKPPCQPRSWWPGFRGNDQDGCRGIPGCFQWIGCVDHNVEAKFSFGFPCNEQQRIDHPIPCLPMEGQPVRNDRQSFGLGGNFYVIRRLEAFADEVLRGVADAACDCGRSVIPGKSGGKVIIPRIPFDRLDVAQFNLNLQRRTSPPDTNGLTKCGQFFLADLITNLTKRDDLAAGGAATENLVAQANHFGILRFDCRARDWTRRKGSFARKTVRELLAEAFCPLLVKPNVGNPPRSFVEGDFEKVVSQQPFLGQWLLGGLRQSPRWIRGNPRVTTAGKVDDTGGSGGVGGIEFDRFHPAGDRRWRGNAGERNDDPPGKRERIED